MAETTKENKAQRAKKYRRRRVTAAVAAAAMCAVIGVGVNGVVTARANTALADALATAGPPICSRHSRKAPGRPCGRAVPPRKRT